MKRFTNHQGTALCCTGVHAVAGIFHNSFAEHRFFRVVSSRAGRFFPASASGWDFYDRHPVFVAVPARRSCCQFRYICYMLYLIWYMYRFILGWYFRRYLDTEGAASEQGHQAVQKCKALIIVICKRVLLTNCLVVAGNAPPHLVGRGAP